MKICSKCEIEKEDIDFANSEFVKKCGICKTCIKEKNKLYRAKNKEKIKESGKLYRKTHREQIKIQRKEHRSLNKGKLVSNDIIKKEQDKTYKREYDKKYYLSNKLKKKEYDKVYRENNKEKIKIHKLRNKKLEKDYKLNNKEKINALARIRQKERRNVDFKFKLRTLVGTSILNALKRRNGSKQKKSSTKYIDINMLYKHIESKFEPWMTWDNHGNYNPSTWNDNDPSTWTWQIDHIIPDSYFTYTSMDDEGFKQSWNINNLRPYNSKQNILDSNRR